MRGQFQYNTTAMKSNVLQNKKAAQRVFVAMSGGVDSSVAALLLRNEGYDVVGVFMRCYNLDGCAERDAEDARRVAEKLSIPFYVWDFEDEYKKKVVKYMVDGYRKGITPNPDVMCNKEIKFGLFFERSLALGADYVATGHYAQVRELKTLRRRRIRLWRKNSKLKTFGLFQAQDKNKDQSYFLWTLTQDQLARCLFPIGEYLKPEVRAIARKAGLPTADKKDSQGICFLGDVSITDFLKKYIRTKRGNILATSGAKIGEHDGAYFYTIGQRHLGISNIKYPAGGEARMGRQKSKTKRDAKPFYVAEKDVKTNTLVVAEGKDNKELYKKEIELTDLNLINPSYFLIRANKKIRRHELRVLARVRYRQPLSAAKVMGQGSGVKLIFAKPQKFVAPGQSAVFYSKRGELLGGGIIL